MSKNVFGPQKGSRKPPKRNRFDVSNQCLTTTDFGLIKPFFCKEVIPGDSISLNPVAAIRSQPIVFPINTRMRFYAHYFYVRNRTLWKDFEDFIFKTKDGLTPPFLDLTPARSNVTLRTGGLGDCLGVPTTRFSGQRFSTEFPKTLTPIGIGYRSSTTLPEMSLDYYIDFINSMSLDSLSDDSGDPLSNYYGLLYPLVTTHRSFADEVFSDDSETEWSFPIFTEGSCSFLDFAYFRFGYLTADNRLFFINKDFYNFSFDSENSLLSVKFFNRSFPSGQLIRPFIFTGGKFIKESTDYYLDAYFYQENFSFGDYFMDTSSSLLNTLSYYYNDSLDINDPLVSDSNPFSHSVEPGRLTRIPLSALPFRAYEMICNYFFRNTQNNPYLLLDPESGEMVPQYNQFIPTYDGGADTNVYDLHRRNWEFDQFTSAVPSPQFGDAPLVGISYSGGDVATLSFQGTDSDGNTQDYAVKVGLDTDGNIQSVVDFDKNIPSGSLRNVIDLSTIGISINDLRNVNAFQRFLENTLRRGLRYRDQLMSHFGVNVDYPDIDVPQFIGGYSGDLLVQPVTNTAETSEAMLGDVAGKIESVIKSNHRISCYCPEHGFIIGVFCIVPVPTYSQILPKMFTRYDAFDYFQTEFGKIGYVPVFMRELAPLQASDPDEVFGYQRAWYDYMTNNDEVHGDFRTSLRDFALYRTFKEKPSLNPEFVEVRNDSLNNIFAVDKVDDKYKNSEKFMVQFYHEAVMKRPIPKYGMPSLE